MMRSTLCTKNTIIDVNNFSTYECTSNVKKGLRLCKNRYESYRLIKQQSMIKEVGSAC